MKKTIMAFALAPATAAVIFGALSVAANPLEDVKHYFIGAASAAALVSYGLSYTVGLIVFFVLKRRKQESTMRYAMLGAFFAFLYAIASTGGQMPSGSGWLMLIVCPLLGAAVATSFALIRGNEKMA